jgi:transcriptional regulator with XRE-family HTH domain
MASELLPQGAILSKKQRTTKSRQGLGSSNSLNSLENLDISPLLKKIGQAIAKQRNLAQMTQATVASKLEIEPESVSRLETGVNAPSLSRLAQFSLLFDCPIEAFFRDDIDDSTDFMATLADITRPLDHQGQKLVLRLVSEVANFVILSKK